MMDNHDAHIKNRHIVLDRLGVSHPGIRDLLGPGIGGFLTAHGEDVNKTVDAVKANPSYMSQVERSKKLGVIT
jgi:hypothetical protein